MRIVTLVLVAAGAFASLAAGAARAPKVVAKIKVAAQTPHRVQRPPADASSG